MAARFEKRNVDGKFKVRDTEDESGQGSWVRDGNGRQIRLDDEERADNITEIMNKRVEGEWHE